MELILLWALFLALGLGAGYGAAAAVERFFCSQC